jgi:hypothetical protein
MADVLASWLVFALEEELEATLEGLLALKKVMKLAY